MRDAVGEELARRWAEPWPWRSALAGAVALHLAVAVLFAVAPGQRRRSLRFPSVQVRMIAPLAAPPGRTQPGDAARPARATAPVTAPQKRPPEVKQPARQPAAPARAAVTPLKAAPAAPRPPLPAREGAVLGPPATMPGGQGGAGAGEQRSSSGAIGLGAGDGGGEEPFPFTYYLSRFVSVVEGNWFRPPAPSDTRCRVRCRIDRGGRLLEAGIEEESAVPAFDRAALRAIYASAPFPPLPQDFTGQSLTLHLDFGPQ